MLEQAHDSTWEDLFKEELWFSLHPFPYYEHGNSLSYIVVLMV